MALLSRPALQGADSESTLVRAAAAIEPCVVNIDTVEEVAGGGVDVRGNPISPGYVTGKGSGVLLSPDGYLVTNHHVVSGATTIRVTTTDGRKFDGRMLGSDPDNDLAVVKIEAQGLPIAELGDSSRLKVGETVLAVGYPLGIGTTVTHGIVSAMDRTNLNVGDGRVLQHAIQTDAPINRGNSGGALANARGQLVGINTAIASEGGGGNIGIGFALPINRVREIVKRLVMESRSSADAPSLPYLGIAFTEVSAETAARMRLKPGEGLSIFEVKPLSAAEDAGLRAGDVLVEAAGRVIKARNDLLLAVAGRKVGDKIAVTVLRENGTRHRLEMVVGRLPQPVKRAD
jgi:S1-C subfamily serine protease